MKEGSWLVTAGVSGATSEVSGVAGAGEVGRTEEGLAGAQEGAGKDRVGVIETIVTAGVGTGGAGRVPCLGRSEGGGKGKEVGIETVSGIEVAGVAGAAGASVLEDEAGESGAEM